MWLASIIFGIIIIWVTITELENEGIKILGTTTEAIDLAEDRDRFSETLLKLKIDQPKNGFAKNLIETKKIADDMAILF